MLTRVTVRCLPTASRIAGALALCIGGACTDPLSGDVSGSAASIRIDTRTPSTLADTDMVVMHATVLDSAGNVLPRAYVTWKSLSTETIGVTEDGHLIGVATSGGRDAKIVAMVASKPYITDTTIAYVMEYATSVGLAPNKGQTKTFGQVALLAVGESAPLHGTGFVLKQILDYRFPPSPDSSVVDQTMRWTSRSPQIATIDRNGVVTARSSGTATIIVQARGGAAVDSGIVVVQQPTLRLATLVPGGVMCGLGQDGAEWCWGYLATISSPPTAANLVGSRFPAVATGGARRYSSLATDGAVACGIATDAVTYCWAITGNKLFGATVANNSPVPFGPDLRFTTVRLGGGSACGITADGVLYCWGSNSYGQLGDGTKVARSEPTLVSGGIRFAAVSPNIMTCGISVDGDAYCWGLSDAGGIGNGITSSSSVPVKVFTSQTFVEIHADFYHACARTSGGEVFCWGNNSFGGLGDGTTTNRTIPLRIAGGYLFSSLSFGDTSCGLTTDGRAVCWGYNYSGTVGDGSFGGAHPTPAVVLGNLRFTSLASSGGRACGQASGIYYCWGENSMGTMGVNRMFSVAVPTQLAGILP